MALNIKDPETEQLAAEVAALAGESKTRAVQVALQDRKARLGQRPSGRDRSELVRRFMEDEVWSQIPEHLLGRQPMSRAEREAILGYGPDGV